MFGEGEECFYMVESISISEAFKMYISDYISFKGQSHKTQEAYTSACNELVRRFGDADLCSLDFSDIRDWKLWLDKGRSSNTVRNYIVCLRVVLRFLKRREYCVINPDDIPVPKRIHTEVEYLTEKEMSDLFAQVVRKKRGYAEINRLKNYAIIKVLYATGLRNNELCSMNIKSIKNNTFTVIGKGNKPRICFVDDDTIIALEIYLNKRVDNNPALFVTKSGTRMKPGDVRRIFEFIRKNSDEFKYVHPHTIRHSYATKLLKRRVDIRYVKEFMGHSSLDTTAMYTHIINEDLKEIYMKAHTH